VPDRGRASLEGGKKEKNEMARGGEEGELGFRGDNGEGNEVAPTRNVLNAPRRTQKVVGGGNPCSVNTTQNEKRSRVREKEAEERRLAFAL